jgi:hypothetical protein
LPGELRARELRARELRAGELLSGRVRAAEMRATGLRTTGLRAGALARTWLHRPRLHRPRLPRTQLAVAREAAAELTAAELTATDRSPAKRRRSIRPSRRGAGRPPALRADWAIGAEARSARETAGARPGPGRARRHRTVVTRIPAEPRTAMPRAVVSRETPVDSRTGAPAGPGVGISPAFVVRPVSGV